MHIITYINLYGAERTVQFPAAQIDHVLGLCKALQRNKVQYSHVFMD